MKKTKKTGLMLSLLLGLTMSIGAGEIFEPGLRNVQDERKTSFRPGQPMGLKGPYLGQKVPGKTPIPFAPDILLMAGVGGYGCGFSPDGKEFYFTRGTKIMVSKWESEGWTFPEPVGFSAGFTANEPHVAFDNKRIYWGWQHSKDFGIWAADRTPRGWSEPTFVGLGMFVSSSRNGDIFATNISLGDAGDYVAKARMVNGIFAGFDRLKGGMDALRPALTVDTAHPAIAPDGSYILFDIKGGSYLYVCFRESDGAWGEAIDLTKHGLDPKAGGAYISPDGKYLFVHLGQGYHWVSTALIEDLRPGRGKIS